MISVADRRAILPRKSCNILYPCHKPLAFFIGKRNRGNPIAFLWN